MNYVPRQYYSPGLFEAWETTNTRWWKLVQNHIVERLELSEKDTENEEEDDIPDFAEDVDPDEHDMDKLLSDGEEDMKQLTNFLSKLYRRFYVKGKEGEQEDPQKDDKLQKLLNLLREEEPLNDQKVLIFSEFRNTARYLEDQLVKAGFQSVEQVDSGRNVKNREMIIKRFARCYNCADAAKNLFSESELSEGVWARDLCRLQSWQSLKNTSPA